MARYWHPDQVADKFFQEVPTGSILQCVLKVVCTHEGDFVNEVGLSRYLSSLVSSPCQASKQTV